MPKTRLEKQATVGELTEQVGKTKSIVFADFQGLKVGEITELRRACHKAGVGYSVAKKTLLKIAFKENGLDIDPKSLEGSFATLFGFTDEVEPARIAADFAKAHEALKIVGGVLERAFADASHIRALAKLPSRQELLGKLAGSLQSPLAGMVNVLSGNLRGLVQVLHAYEEKKTAQQAG